MALKRQKNNIVNLALMVVTADEKAGMSIDQTILNGKSATVSVRLLNGGRKSAAIKLDRGALSDLQEALTEILATDGDF
jgi:P pilus assembly chaperone PapD